MTIKYLVLISVLVSRLGEVSLKASDAGTPVPCDNANIFWAPYAWKHTGAGLSARAEATMPGAYVKLTFQNSSDLQLLVDGTANEGCPAIALPVLDYTVDEGPFQVAHLTNIADTYALPLAKGLSKEKQHSVVLYFRAAGLNPNRWKSSAVHLRITGVQLEASGSLLPTPVRSKRALIYGDSITEGVCVEGLCPYYQNLLMNNARETWCPIVCAALDCEYGQLGTGGQGMVRTTMEMPPLEQTWDHYDAATSRLIDGFLDPEPDYIFCEMGSNDFESGKGKQIRQMDITAAYIKWLKSVRMACPHAKCFCIVPPLGWHAEQVRAAVDARNDAGDHRVYLIATAPLQGSFRGGQGATSLAGDGVHPTLYGDALLGALIAVEAQKTLSAGDR